MKTLLQTLFFFLLVSQICFAQWYQQNSGTTKNLNAVQFIDSNNGFVVGDSGIILHSSDAGLTWVTQMSGTSFDLKDVAFVSAYQGWAIGGKNDPESGFLGGDTSVILYTSNGGISWQTDVSGTGYGCFFDCCFIDANNGTVVGSVKDSSGTTIPVILHTNNGGVSWYLQNSPLPYLNAISAVHFNDQNIGWMTPIAGSMYFGSRITKTTDGGLNWQLQYTLTAWPLTILKRIKFRDNDNGFAVGWWYGYHPAPNENNKIKDTPPPWGIMFYTTDGGVNWINTDSYYNLSSLHPLLLHPLLLHPLNDVFLFGTEAAIAVGDSGDILFTPYAVGSWIEQTSGTDSSLNGVYFVDDLIGWVVGDGGTILHTTNGGNPVPVELATFSASANGKEVTLNWSTATELNNQGFEVQRKFGDNSFVTIGSVKGNGTTTSSNNYTYVDKLIDPGKYFYRLKQIDFGGKYEYSQTVEVNWSPFSTYKLEQNYSNPFNPTTTIGFGIPEKGNVRLSVLNILGEEIKVLLNEQKEAGYHSIEFNGSDLPSGVYFYKLKVEGFQQTKKMILLR